jgi:hypothetical protein
MEMELTELHLACYRRINLEIESIFQRQIQQQRYKGSHHSHHQHRFNQRQAYSEQVLSKFQEYFQRSKSSTNQQHQIEIDDIEGVVDDLERRMRIIRQAILLLIKSFIPKIEDELDDIYDDDDDDDDEDDIIDQSNLKEDRKDN